MPDISNASQPNVLDLFRLHGKRALITGSSGGIGLALARALGQAGATIILNGRNSKKLQEAVALLQSEGLLVQAAAFDVTDPKSVINAVEGLERSDSTIDILVNNAGIQIRNVLHEFEEADWQMLMKTNLDSVFYVSKAVAKHMIERKQGKIINICSVQSELGRPNIAPYAASKGALKMLTKGMAIDWGPHGINVNGLGPGYFKTELTEKLVADTTFTHWLVGRTPCRRWGEVQELGGAAVYLASEASRFVNGHILYVDGGVTATL